jgi:DNA repair exonuclease SbcCD ATPase subunit
MRIKYAEIKNYRIHKERSVTFDDKLTIISGPNESGKSTLAEALHRALFLKSRTGGAIREKMLSRDGAIPEVMLSLELDNRKVGVRKVFNGTAKGLTVLDVAGEGTISGDAADERLAQLLLVPNALGSNETALGQRWAHLWVWQGSSGGSPLEAVAEAKQSLVARLNAIGGAAVSQSELDDKVIRALLERRDRLYTQNGADFKVSSEPGLALKELERAKATLDERLKDVARLDSAIIESESAARLLQEKGLALQAALNELETTKGKSREAGRLQESIEPLQETLQEVEQELASIQQATEDIFQDRQNLEKATSASQACENQLAALSIKRADSASQLEDALQKRDSILSEQELHKIHLDALRDQRLLLQRQAELKKLEESCKRIGALRKEIIDLRRQAESIPAIEKKDVKALDKLRVERLQAKSVLDALGARVKHVKGDSAVTVDHEALPVDGECLLTQDADILIGETLLRVTLGNVSNLRQATADLESAEEKLEKKLQSLGCATYEAALEAQERRGVLLDKATGLEERLEEYAPEQVEADRVACRLEIDRTTARLKNSLYLQTELPTDSKTLEAEFDHFNALGQETDTRCQAQAILCKQREAEKKKAEDACAELTGKRQTLREQTISLTVGLDAKVKLHGSDEERAKKRLALLTTQEQSGHSLKILRVQLDTLQPDLLESDTKRLEETITRAKDIIQQAQVRRQVAEQTLVLDGNSDPRATLAAAQAKFEFEDLRFSHLKTQAEAIRHLAELATNLQKEISKQINRPLEEKAKAYLETVFGPGVTVSLSEGIQTHATPSIEIDRPGIGRFTFSELSGGAHEQVGVALRLAMAEVLAEGYGGSLPIVLDDAFVNSDPDRVKSLHRMLYLAAQHGLQVIVLTCNPSDYDTLGATEIRL